MKISFAITVCDEIEEIKRLVPFILENKRIEDEIVVLYDSKNGDQNVLDFLLDFNKLPHVQTWRSDQFKNDFSEWKNLLNSYCDGDYIFQLDADEMIDENLIPNVYQLVEMNPEVDLFYFPRINIVDRITEEHIQKWGWRIDSIGRINYPDYQGRLYKKGLMWKGNVHERIVGGKHFSILPGDDIYSIHHIKTIIKQEKQNNYYNTL